MIRRKKTTKHLIAYMDILGGAKLISEDILDENLNTVAQIYQLTKNIVNTAKSNLACSIDFKIFSDNILLTLIPEINDKQESDRSIYNFLYVIAFIQIKALERNILLRGGLTIGDIFINKTFSWGKGLLSAIDLEEKKAIVPRIIIDENAKLQIDKVAQRNPEKIINTLQDFDGWLFIDYLSCWGNQHLETIKKHLFFIENELQKENCNSKVMHKLLWHKNYCNGYLATNPRPLIFSTQGGLNA